MNTKVMFSSASDHWATPSVVYRALDDEFSFTLDPCPLYGTGGLESSWSGYRVFCNPPYSSIRPWLEKHSEPKLVVYLLPSRTDTKWFHEIALPYAKEIRFLRGRLKFGGSKNSAPFPSLLAVFRNQPLHTEVS